MQANSNCTAQGQTSDVQTGVSLRVLKVGSDGSNVDAQIQQWSEAFHEEVGGSSDFGNQTETDVTQETYTPAPLPEIYVSEIIPDNHGNLLASWDYSVGTYDQTCTDTYSLVPHRHLISFSCSGEVPGQPDHAHISLLNGTSLQSDFTLDGVDYFDGPMMMGEGDTVFGIGGKMSDDMDRVIALNATNGATLWTSTGTFDSLEPVVATADGGIVINDTPSSGGNATVVRYDANGNLTLDSVNGSGVQYLRSNGLLLALDPDGFFSGYADIAIDLTRSFWDQPNGNGARTAQTEWPQLVRCSDEVTSECEQHGWTTSTGGPRDWVFNALYALENLLGAPCLPGSSDPVTIQACDIDTYVFTNLVKDANGNQAYRTGLLGFLLKEPPQFYDPRSSTLPVCESISSCDGSTQIKADFASDPFDATTVIFDSRQKPNIPPLRTFFNPGIIYRELRNTQGPHDADNMAMVFHEALHAYTRLPDFVDVLNVAGPSLKKELQCSDSIGIGTYDITAFLMQFTSLNPPAVIKGCAGFSTTTRPTVPPQ